MDSLYKQESDEAILARSVTEPGCFAELVERYQAAFYRKGRGIIHDPEKLTDVVQETFVKIYLNASKFKEQENAASFRPWAYKIFLNTCFSAYKKEKREREFFSVLDPELIALAPDEKSLSVESRWAWDDLLVLVSRLPLLLRRVALLHLVEGRSQEEVAQLEGVPVGTIRTRLHRARRALQKLVLSDPNFNLSLASNKLSHV